MQFKGFPDESGTYICRNTLGEIYRQFQVAYFDEEKLSITETIAIAVSVILLIIFVAALSIGIKLYLKQASRDMFVQLLANFL